MREMEQRGAIHARVQSLTIRGQGNPGRNH